MLLTEGRRVIPAFGDVTIEGTTLAEPPTSPVGGKGEFYLENVPAGLFELRIDYLGESCRAPIEVPEDIRIAVDVGEIVCTPDEP